MLASGLAFKSLFAILPAILLVIAVVGVLLGDSVRLAAISANLSASFPPLAGFFTIALRSFADGAISYSIVGVVALIWGASRFYQSLDDAMARIFQSVRRRDPIRRSLFGILSVLLFTAVVGSVIGLMNVVGNGPRGIVTGPAGLAGAIATAATSVLVFSVGLAIVYRFVPTNRPSWQMIRRPALVVGIFAGSFTALSRPSHPSLSARCRCMARSWPCSPR